MANYDFKTIEKKWQDRWEKEGTFRAIDDFSLPKFYGSSSSPIRAAQACTSATSRLIPAWRSSAASAGCRLQRPVPDRLRRIRTARRELRDKDRHPSTHSHRSEHPQFHRSAQARRLRVRLEPRCRYDRHRLLQVDPVDIPQDVRARTRFPRQGVRQLLPELQMRALQRGLTGRQVRHLPQRCYPEVEGRLVPAHNRIRRQAA